MQGRAAGAQDDQYAITAQLTPPKPTGSPNGPPPATAAPRRLTGIGEHDHP